MAKNSQYPTVYLCCELVHHFTSKHVASIIAPGPFSKQLYLAGCRSIVGDVEFTDLTT